jgi:hypothetical protein
VFARTVRRTAPLLVGGAVLISSGCGGGGTAASAAGLRLQREDLIAVARALQGAQGEVAAEGRAAKAAWPLIANGLSAAPSAAGSATIDAATRSALAIHLPGLFEELKARGLTGPGSGLAGTFRRYLALSSTAWQQIQYAIGELRSGPGAQAVFAKANVALYIETVYDAHFSLAQIGKQLMAGYSKLDGPGAFGDSLSASEVAALSASYSEGNYRLHPHAGVRLGS